MSKGDKEIVYLAKKKSESKPIITIIREINKKKKLKNNDSDFMSTNSIASLKKSALFLSSVKHKNLL